MITVFVTKEGYYVKGEGVEASLRCSPALDSHGNPIFHELHHTYKVMFLALKEVARKGCIKGDVIVYNDSRIIDEMNGNAKPLDEVCQKWQMLFRRQVLPHIRSIVVFRKKASDYIMSQVRLGHSLLTPSDPATINELTERLEKAEVEKIRSFKGRILDRFKRMWTNG
jgi:hypothetical protein